MIRSAIPIDEEIRLQELRSFGIGDSREPALDEIVWLASHIAQAPMAFISLVDETCEWTKASVGWDLKKISREFSFCGHIVANRSPLIISHVLLDPRFNDSLLVLDHPHIQFYAGFPLQTATGQVLGALCVADREPRVLDDKQIQALEHLSRQTMREFEMRKSQEKQVRMEAELQLFAKQIQQQQIQLDKETRLSSLGQLARGVSHEINNSLLIISGKAQMLLRSARKELFTADQLEQHIEVILRACDKIVNRTKGFSKFSRDGSEDPFEVVRVLDLVEEVQKFFDPRFMKMKIHFEKSGSEDLTFECRRLSICQMLIHFVGNSVEALQDTPEKHLRIFWQQMPGGLEIRVQDNGRSLSAEERSSVMNPQFSIYGLHRGSSGMGLGLAKKICEAHQGRFRLSERMDLTEFTIFLPLSQPSTAAAPSKTG